MLVTLTNYREHFFIETLSVKLVIVELNDHVSDLSIVVTNNKS